MTDHIIDVLQVEDNQDHVELAKFAFKKSNFANRVHVVRDGAEALEYIFGSESYAGRKVEQMPRLILLDLKLPKVDGLDVLRQVKADPRTKNTPVVTMTSSREESDLVASYALGVNSYIAKPVDFQQFVECARTLGLYWLLLNEPPASTTGIRDTAT